jgi:hypothetical protein
MTTAQSEAKEALAALGSTMHLLQWTMPLDPAEHRRRLARSLVEGAHTYPYAFAYDDVPSDSANAAVAALAASVQRLPNDPLTEALLLLVERTTAQIAAIAARDDAAWTSVCADEFGYPSSAMVEASHALLEQPTQAPDKPDEQPIGHAEMQRLVREALDKYDLGHWEVSCTSQMAAAMSVNTGLNRVSIRSGTTFTTSQARRLLVHEVGGHVLRAENARRQPHPLASAALPGHALTEEGLAVLLENEFDVAQPAQARLYAARVVAVDTAQRGGIVEVARAITPAIGVELACEIAIRVKRGLVDPNTVGGNSKDHVYASGSQDLKARTAQEVSSLRALRWPVGLLAHVQELWRSGELLPSHLVPDERLLMGQLT